MINAHFWNKTPLTLNALPHFLAKNYRYFLYIHLFITKKYGQNVSVDINDTFSKFSTLNARETVGFTVSSFYEISTSAVSINLHIFLRRPR